MAIQREDKRIAGLAVSGHIRDLYRQAVLTILFKDQRYRPAPVFSHCPLTYHFAIEIDSNG